METNFDEELDNFPRVKKWERLDLSFNIDANAEIEQYDMKKPPEKIKQEEKDDEEKSSDEEKSNNFKYQRTLSNYGGFIDNIPDNSFRRNTNRVNHSDSL